MPDIKKVAEAEGRHIYAGLSTDVKITAGVNAGSILFETNTSKTYLFNSNAWLQIKGLDSGGNLIENVLSANIGYTGTLASTTVAVADLTTIGAAINVSNFSRIKVRINNSDDTGTAAILFDAFEIQASVDGGSNFETLFSTAGEYTSPIDPLIGSSGNLTILAADATGWFLLDVAGIDQIRVQASADTTESVGVTGTWSAN